MQDYCFSGGGLGGVFQQFVIGFEVVFFVVYVFFKYCFFVVGGQCGFDVDLVVVQVVFDGGFLFCRIVKGDNFLCDGFDEGLLLDYFVGQVRFKDRLFNVRVCFFVVLLGIYILLQ